MSSELKKASAGFKFYGSIMAFLIFGVLVIVWRCFSPTEESLDKKRAEARAVKLAALQKENDQKLLTYAWVSKDKGVVQIPVARAMELVAAELAAKPVAASAVKLENPYPFGLQNLNFAPAPAASGSAAPVPAASGSAAPAASGTTVPAASGTDAPPPTPAASGTTTPPAQ